MKTISKEKILTLIAIIILLGAALIDWTLQSWIVLVGIIILLMAWQGKKSR